ncbi:MAG: S8 family serine peptidase [Gemmatimonadaceae bacterium]
MAKARPLPPPQTAPVVVAGLRVLLAIACVVTVASCSDRGATTESSSSGVDASAVGARALTDTAVEIVIAFHDSITASDRAFLRSHTAHVERYTFRGFPALLIKVPHAALPALRANPRVRYAQTGGPIELLAETTGWHFLAAPRGNDITRVHNDSSLGNARYGAGIGIAIVDTGIDCYGVLDFFVQEGSAGCAGGVDFTGENQPFFDARPHGTQVASIVLAAAGNNKGVRGIAPKAVVYSLRIFNSINASSCLWSGAAIDYATYDLATTVSIINLSYSSGPANTDAEKAAWYQGCQPEDDAIYNAVASDRLVVAGAGNSSDSVHFPARLTGVVAVSGLTCNSSNGSTCGGLGGTDPARFWPTSSRGPQLDLSAAAENVPKLVPGGTVDVAEDGTSFAAAIVAGIAAQVQSKHNKPRTGTCTRTHLRNTAYKPRGLDSLYLGQGFVNGYNAWTTPFPTGAACAGGPI